MRNRGRARGRTYRLIPPQRGFTLIEVLCAVVVLTVGLLSGFYLFAQGTMMNTDSKATTSAFMAAQRQIEALRTSPFADINTGSFTPTATNLANPTGSVNVNTSGDNLLKSVTVVVSWQDRGGLARQVSLATTIAKEGMGAP